MADWRSRTIVFLTDDGFISNKVFLSSDVISSWKKQCRVFDVIDECQEDNLRMIFDATENKYIVEQKSLIESFIKVLKKYLDENDDNHQHFEEMKKLMNSNVEKIIFYVAENEELKYIDFTSLYPYAQKKY